MLQDPVPGSRTEVMSALHIAARTPRQIACQVKFPALLHHGGGCMYLPGSYPVSVLDTATRGRSKIGGMVTSLEATSGTPAGQVGAAAPPAGTIVRPYQYMYSHRETCTRHAKSRMALENHSA